MDRSLDGVKEEEFLLMVQVVQLKLHVGISIGSSSGEVSSGM